MRGYFYRDAHSRKRILRPEMSRDNGLLLDLGFYQQAKHCRHVVPAEGSGGDGEA